MNSVYEEVAFSRRIADPGKPSEEMVEKILFRMGISEIKNRHPHSLSQGEKQRVTVASAIAKRPDVLLLDEPTSGMDGYHLGLLIESLAKLKKDGLTIIIASHDAELLFKLCGRFFVIENGKVYETGGSLSNHMKFFCSQ